jgi:hypothetical protein
MLYFCSARAATHPGLVLTNAGLLGEILRLSKIANTLIDS